MPKAACDVVILGAGFAGSVLAQTLQRVGRSVVIVERGSHPRFAVGESSTPLGNLALEEISRTYDLPRLMPLTEFGRWKKAYPHLAVGLKRGFSYYQHEAGKPFVPLSDHANELLVAASPNDEVSDTHWFREHFDHFLLQEAQAAGVPYFDRTELTSLEHDDGWTVRGVRDGVDVQVGAKFLVDAAGPGGPLLRTLNIDTTPDEVRTSSWSVYSHFENVALWDDQLADLGADRGDHPYRTDDAALHHILNDGWIYVLRFDNGVTSAGVCFDGRRRPPQAVGSPEAEWTAVLARYPSVARQFAEARPVRPFVRTARMQRRARTAAGLDWALLPHAAYFLDPFFSPGNAHTLFGVARLTRILESAWGRPTLAAELRTYGEVLLQEGDFLDRLIHGAYSAFGRFEKLTAFLMYYFAGAIQAETRRRSGVAGSDDRFLFMHHAPFREAVCRAYESLVAPSTSQDDPTFTRQVAQDIADYNPAGLCDPAKRNLYPFVS
jgi:FADH2 O2-dependent halogenase